MSASPAVVLVAFALLSCAEPAAPQGARAEPKVVTPPPPNPPTPAQEQAAPQFKPPAPGFEPGLEVFDPSGAKIGVVETMAPSPGGLSIVLLIDGKLVSVSEANLRRIGPRVISSETKAQILSRAGAPR